MYAHLEKTGSIPLVTTGYRFRSKCSFRYGDIQIEVECAYPENAGKLDFTLFSDAVQARLIEGELPFRDKRDGVRYSREELLELTLSKRDVSYLLSLFGVLKGRDFYGDVRRRRLEVQEARKHKWFELFELRFSQNVDETWLRDFGGLLGWRGDNKVDKRVT